MRVDQLKVRAHLNLFFFLSVFLNVSQDFLKAKSQSVSGKKADLIERVTIWIEKH